MASKITSVIIGKDHTGQRHVITFRDNGTFSRKRATVQDVANIARWLVTQGAVFHGQITDEQTTSEIITL